MASAASATRDFRIPDRLTVQTVTECLEQYQLKWQQQLALQKKELFFWFHAETRGRDEASTCRFSTHAASIPMHYFLARFHLLCMFLPCSRQEQGAPRRARGRDGATRGPNGNAVCRARGGRGEAGTLVFPSQIFHSILRAWYSPSRLMSPHSHSPGRERDARDRVRDAVRAAVARVRVGARHTHRAAPGGARRGRATTHAD